VLDRILRNTSPSVQNSRRASPPQTIISLPVQTAVVLSTEGRGISVLMVDSLFVLGLYLAPNARPRRSFHCRSRRSVNVVHPPLRYLVAVQVSVLGGTCAGVKPRGSVGPAPTIIALPVQTAL